MANNKVWRVVGRKEKYSDYELRQMISKGELKREDKVYSNEIDKPIALDETIYRFYFI